ncbi:MAG: nitroreductase [Emergencia sp.]|jgi:nitroreductase|uniref:Nitroreductase n=2 Tax=Oscillospiraceae TaxID=216572 RepID=A0A845QJ91_9FIRM|nr:MULTISPECIES: nitroreductase family protein [Anaerotruncus]MCI9475436.1 nitroreductase [Emergencia sp.]MCI9639548.1 nitroreductase [Emergencia sp.]NBH61085.1 nitroreductase [Anaerotruncus colihominis]NCF01740.1 nitroreductase [Anaerotruncus sp. 80]
MEAITCIKERRSIRKFKPEVVDHEVVREIVEAASFAPSWKNTQITRYIVVEDEAVKEKIADECVLGFTYNAKIIKNTPQLVVATYINGRSGFEKDGSYTTGKEDRWQNFDTGIAVQTFCLAAHDKGIGTVILGIFDDEKVAEAINLPEGQTVAALIPMGYPLDAEAPAAPKRKEADELVSYL